MLKREIFAFARGSKWGWRGIKSLCGFVFAPSSAPWLPHSLVCSCHASATEPFPCIVSKKARVECKSWSSSPFLIHVNDSFEFKSAWQKLTSTCLPADEPSRHSTRVSLQFPSTDAKQKPTDIATPHPLADDYRPTSMPAAPEPPIHQSSPEPLDH